MQYIIGAGPGSLNAINTFQGILTTASCLGPTVPGYIPGEQRFNTAPFTPAQASDPQFPGLFVNQNFLNPSSFFPLGFLPFGYPQARNFVYAYAQQANFSVERDLGGGFALNLAYNFNGGRHLNRPINANTSSGDLVMNNYLVALTDPTSFATQGGPLGVGAGSAPCGFNPGGQPWVSAALTNFFRPSAVNPALALAYLSNPLSAPCVTAVLPLVLGEDGLKTTCNYATLAGCVPFSDMDANYSNGSSVYHGFSANLRKRFNRHYEFLASYTWSHAIDDSTDLQAPLAPQDSYYPAAERSNSLFDQRHRFVFSGVYQTGKLGGNAFARRFFSDWTFAPIIEFSSGRPYNIITGNSDNFQFSPDTGRPNTTQCRPAPRCGYPVYNTKYFSDWHLSGALPGILQWHAPVFERQPGPQRRDTTLDRFQRYARRQAHLLRRALQHGLDRRYVQHCKPLQRSCRQPALQQRWPGHSRVRPAAVPVRAEI